jgi:hypothetical protein
MSEVSLKFGRGVTFAWQYTTAEGEADITRVQRMTYAIKGGLSNQFIEEELDIDFNEMTLKLNQVLGSLINIRISMKKYIIGKKK